MIVKQPGVSQRNGTLNKRSSTLNEIHQQLFEIADLLKSIEQELSGSFEDHPAIEPKFSLERRRYEIGDEFVDLSRTEAIILEKLIECEGEPVSIETLCEALGLDSVGQRLNIKSYVFRLRVKLNSLTRPAYDIQVVREAGYCAYRCA